MPEIGPMRAFWAAAVLLAACGTALPSAEPLGEGPMFKAEAEARARAADAGDAGEAVAQGPSKHKPSKPESKPDAAAAPSAIASAAPAAADAGAAPAKSDAGAASTATPDIAGEYVGSDVSKYKMGGMEREEKDDKARTRVSAPAGKEVAFTFVDSSNGKDICTLKATLAGKTATFTAGQKCWGTDDQGMSGTLTKGTATFSDKRVVIDTDFDLAFSGPVQMTGTLGYHFDGTKK